MILSDYINKVTTKVPTCHSEHKVEAVKKYILDNAQDLETVNYVYVLSKSNKLKGVISIRELFGSPSGSRIGSLMTKKPIKAHLDTDKEKIAHLALKNSIKSIPIVDKENNFLGIVPSDDILKILNSEANEDFMRMTGIIPHEAVQEHKLHILKSFFARTPWIILGLFGGILAARIISGFESTLEKEIMLATFIPLVAYIANAVGVQTQTLYIRDLAVSQNVKVIEYGLKQTAISVLIGGTCWAVIAGMSLVSEHFRSLGFIVGFAVFCAIIVATIFSIAIPYLLVRLNKDPAIGSGPFTTIIQDMLSIIIYFMIASAFIL